MTLRAVHPKNVEYLSNVSRRNSRVVRSKAFAGSAPNHQAQSELKAFVMRMRREGTASPPACNCRIRAVNAYLKWAGSPHRVLQS